MEFPLLFALKFFPSYFRFTSKYGKIHCIVIKYRSTGNLKCILSKCCCFLLQGGACVKEYFPLDEFQHKASAKRTSIARQIFRIMLVKHACEFEHHNVPVKFQKHLCLSQAKNVCQACACVMAKLTNIVLDKQSFKCMSNTDASSFGRGLRQFLNFQCRNIGIIQSNYA